MKTRHILSSALIVAALWHSAAAQPKKKRIQVEAPPTQKVLVGTSMQSNSVLSDLVVFKAEMPLGPQDVLKSYEVAMGLVADKTSTDFAIIVQAEQTNQVTREQAEYLLRQTYQMAMMQYQALSALHEVLKRDMDEAAAHQAKPSLNTVSSDTVVVVPFPGSAASR